MDGVAEPKLLIKGGASPHTYALRPSDASALEGADVIFWVGETLEGFLEKPLESLGGNARIVELMEAPGIRLRHPERDGNYEPHDHDHDHDHDDGGEDHEDHDDHIGADAHIWLSPGNAAAIVTAAVTALEQADPAHAAIYRANGERVTDRIGEQAGRLRDILTPVSDKPFVVFHDAYGYFEEAFGLHSVGSITVSPDRLPGARRLDELHGKIARLGAVCVFREPQFAPKLAQAIVEGTEARLGVLDPLGAELGAGKELYFELMRKNADSLAACLSR